jgi:pyruvate-ferredoxin/flavodoxin oxidoreductase
MGSNPRFPGIRVNANGNQLVSYHTEARIADAGVFYPITPSTEGGELYQQSFAEGRLNVFGRNTLAVEAEGEHAAQGGAIAISVCGRRVVNFTSGQGIVYGVEQYYHAPGKCSTMVLEVVARALTKHALNVHCGHDDVYGALDTGWIIVFAKDAQQAADQALILRRVTELSLTPGMNVQDGFLTSHLERTFYKHEADLIREFLGAPDDIIDCPTESQRTLFGPKRRRVPRMIDLTNPVLLGPVQNQEHYMQGVVARRNNFAEPILRFLEESHEEFGKLTGRHYGLLSEYRTDDADTVYVSLGSAAENIEAGVDHLRETQDAKVGSIHLNVIRPFPEEAVVRALAGKKNVIILERTDEPMAGANPMGRDIRTALAKALGRKKRTGEISISSKQMPRLFDGVYGLGSRDFRPEHILGAYEYVAGKAQRKDGETAAKGSQFFVLGVDHPYEVKSADTPSLLPDDAIAIRFHSIGGWGAITTGKNLGAIIGDFNDSVAQRLRGRARPRGGRAGTAQGDHPRQRQPEVRLRKEGGADVLLPRGGPRADSGELRPAARGRRAVLRSQGLHPHQPPRRDVGGRGARLGVGRRARPGVGAAAPLGPQDHPREEDPRLHASRLRYRPKGHEPARPPAAHAGKRLPGGVLRGLAPSGPVRDRRRALPRGRPQAVQEEVRPLR